MNQQFLLQMMPSPPEPLNKARGLFHWLWKEKPARYELHGAYKLSDVVDAQCSVDNQAVGNCLGLTLLYNCLLRRTGIVAEAVHLENAFERGPHVFTILQIKGSLIDIENILPGGFDYKGHLDDPTRTRWGDRELVADIYFSLGNELFSKDDFIKALEHYEMALHLNPRYERAHLNKTILFDKLEMIRKDRLKRTRS